MLISIYSKRSLYNIYGRKAPNAKLYGAEDFEIKLNLDKESLFPQSNHNFFKKNGTLCKKLLSVLGNFSLDTEELFETERMVVDSGANGRAVEFGAENVATRSKEKTTEGSKKCNFPFFTA